MPRSGPLGARVSAALIALAALVGGCRAEPTPAPGPSPTSAATPAEPDAGRAAAAPASSTVYARSLAQQLDLVPPDADAYLAIRDLRPLVEQGRRVEQVLAGPLARAVPALAGLAGATGAERAAELDKTRELLALLLAGLESSGVALDQGALVVQRGGEAPLILFAAADLRRLGALAAVVGAAAELERRCAALTEVPGWFVCSLAEGPAAAEAVAGYSPAGQGAALVARLAARLGLAGPDAAAPAAELDAINVAMSLAEPDGSLDAGLRTDPGLWELTVPVASMPAAGLVTAGPAPALAGLVPGTSFAWARVDPTLLGAGLVEPGQLSGELWLGVVDAPDGLVAELGVVDPAAVADQLERLAAGLPDQAIELAALDGARIELDRASIELAGQRRPSVGASLVGDPAASWAATLGVPARARIWVAGGYLSAAVGEVQAIPAALVERREAEPSAAGPSHPSAVGPSPEALAGLPPTLAAALVAGEVALVVHLVLDHWQAPPSEAELASLWTGLTGEPLAGGRPDADVLAQAAAAAFEVLAPWSSVDVWLRRRGERWLAQVSLVPFPGPAAADEREAASAVLDAVLAGGDGGPGYRALLARFPRSSAAASYRARAGLAPDHHAAIAMVEVGLVTAVVMPTVRGYVDRAKTREAGAETQAILSAALAVHDRTGSCAALLGEVGPTPALSVQCHAGDGGRCRPVAGPGDGPGEYPRSAWLDDPLWSALDYRPNRGVTGSHRYHYSFAARLDPGEGGRCEVEVRAIGDLDGDGELATYTRTATIAADGSRSLPAMRVEAGDE